MITRLASAASAALAAIVLTGCAAGFDAETERDYAPSDGVIGSVGDLKLRSVIVVNDEDNERASLVAVVVNDGSADDELTGLSIDDAELEADLPAAVDLGEPLSIGSRGEDDLLAIADDIDFVAGDFVDVTFEFRDAGSVTLQALSVAPTGDYEDYAPPVATIQ